MKVILTDTYHFFKPIFISLIDMNRDNVKEVITMEGDQRFRHVYVSEWQGEEFSFLNIAPNLDLFEYQRCSDLLGPSHGNAIDVDGNGIFEFVLNQEIPIWSEYTDGLPWRKETRTCTWNGQSFVMTDYELAPAEFRFQAVQDGDRASLEGDFVKALDLYQQAIFSDQLDWWSMDRAIYEIAQSTGNSTDRPMPEPDPDEYPNLAAYSRYRIMLLHAVQGYIPEAQTVYDTLQEKFPESEAGHSYVEMADAFWQEFQLSGDMKKACSMAIHYATQNPSLILRYLGNGAFAEMWFGDQSLTYTPNDICPFHNQYLPNYNVVDSQMQRFICRSKHKM